MLYLRRQAWTENEYDLNMTYADDKVVFSPYLQKVRQAIREDTIRKIAEAKQQ